MIDNVFRMEEAEGEYFAMFGSDPERYPLGSDKELADIALAKLQKAHRPNLENRCGVTFVCWNHHDKGRPCEFEPLVVV